jgi:hypothetical protein
MVEEWWKPGTKLIDLKIEFSRTADRRISTIEW